MKIKRGDEIFVKGIKCIVMSVGRAYALVISMKASSFPTWVPLESIDPPF